jgi:hypothetical protein
MLHILRPLYSCKHGEHVNCLGDKWSKTLLSLFGYFRKPEASFLAFSSFHETRVCGTKVQPLFYFFLLVNFELSWFSLASILNTRVGFLVRYACKQFHARKLITNFKLAYNPSI